MQSTSRPITAVSPSLTALLVMVGFKLTLENGYKDLLDKDELLLVNHMINTAIASEPNSIKWALEKSFVSLPYFAQQGFLNRGISPAFDAHKAARKLMIKNKIEDDIQRNNVEQVVFLSGGYDPRSYILSRKYKNVQFFELDRGDTRKIKIDALMQIPKIINTKSLEVSYSPTYVSFNHNLHLIECDFLVDDLKVKLKDGGYCQEKKTLFIAEGLTMYLSELDNQNLLGKLYDLLRDDEEVLLSYRSMLNNPLAITDKMHESSKETFQFAIPPNNITTFTNKKGFEVTGKMLCSDLIQWIHCQVAYMAPQSTAPRGDNYYLLKRNSQLIEGAQVNVEINSLPPIVSTEITNHKYESRGCTLL